MQAYIQCRVWNVIKTIDFKIDQKMYLNTLGISEMGVTEMRQ